MEKIVSNVVFTKNRPLQLEAYLESLYRNIPAELVQTYVLYKVDLFDEQYTQLFRKYSNCIVIRESNFSGNFLRLLNQINTKYILFGIDDVVYFDSVDFGLIEEVFDSYPDDIFGFSLRFGQNIVDNGKDIIEDVVVGEQIVHRVNWNFGRTPNTKYPFELCATIYRTDLVKQIIASLRNSNRLIKKLFSPGSALIKALAKLISTRPVLKSFGYFYNPNTLESWNCRWCQDHSEQLPSFLYFQRLCASAIQVNMVNVTMRKIFDGSAEHTVEALNDKYKQGYRLDIGFVAKNKPRGTHGGRECFKLTKRWQA